jgi:HEAT repeat protein
MGQTANSKFGNSLIKGLQDENLENRIAAIKGLGMIRFNPSVNKLNNISISNSNIQERLAAVISLGEIGDKSSEVYLLSLLEDEEPNIRWDSAIALIKIGNKKGVYILEKLLKRSYYNNYSNINENEVNNSILTVLALASKYPVASFKDELEFLAKKEENIKIREFSMKILAEHY